MHLHTAVAVVRVVGSCLGFACSSAHDEMSGAWVECEEAVTCPFGWTCLESISTHEMSRCALWSTYLWPEYDVCCEKNTENKNNLLLDVCVGIAYTDGTCHNVRERTMSEKVEQKGGTVFLLLLVLPFFIRVAEMMKRSSS